MTEFEKKSLGEVLGDRGYIRGPFGSALVRSELQKHGIPVYEQQHAITGTRKFRFFVNDEKFKELSRFQVRPNDLIISCSGTIGRISVIQPTDPTGIISQALLILRPHSRDVLPEFLYYFLSTSEGQHALVQASHGSVQVNIAPRAVVERIELPVPRLSEQHAIAHILGTLDDKIELNRQMNETLEAIVRALFKSWFVDFDPVRAKAEGCNPGLPNPFADLFPDAFELSELGEIPKGWVIKPLKELTSYLSRGISPAYVDEGGILVLNQKCVRDGRVDSSKGRRHDPNIRSVEGRTLKTGDVLVNSTGVGTLGRVAQLLALEEDAIVDSHVTVIRANDAEVSWNFLGIELAGRAEEIEAMAEGSTGQTELSRLQLAKLLVIVPPPNVLAEFDRLCIPVRQRKLANEKESCTLIGLRDTLLPKLISGKLRIKNPERFIGGEQR